MPCGGVAEGAQLSINHAATGRQEPGTGGATVHPVAVQPAHPT